MSTSLASRFQSSVSASSPFARLQKQEVSGFGLVKAKLKANQNVTIFINGDSTAYSDYGPYFKFGVALGDLYNANVIMYRWAEWDGAAATGPKQYSAPVTLRTGTGPTITIYLASIPGKVAGTMFSGSRRTKAIDEIPTPDVCIMHHGHNQQSFNMPTGINLYGPGAGTFLGPLGMTQAKWPNVPHIMTTQNPWRDDTGYTKVYEAIKLVGRIFSDITVFDTHALFVNLLKNATLYRDNVHPSDTSANSKGAQLICDYLIDRFKATWDSPFATQAWPLVSAQNLIDNGGFTDWTAAVPAGWSLAGSGTSCSKDTVDKYETAPYSLSLSPSLTVSGQLTYIQKYLSNAEMARIAGKTVSLAILCKGSSTQPRAYASFGIPDFTGSIKTYVMGDVIDCADGWMWLVVPNIPVINNAAETWKYLRIFPAFGTPNPTLADPLKIQKVLIVEGSKLKGIIGS